MKATRNPFPGLRPFEPHEWHLFFGRDKQVGEMLMRLRRTRFLAVVGTSGSGKSSLVRAGLVPALHGGMMRGVGSGWHVAICRPGSRPIQSLAKALAHPEPDFVGEESGERGPWKEAQLEVMLERSSVGLRDAMRRILERQRNNLLVVVDQFEELFRFRKQLLRPNASDEAAAFVNLLLEAVRDETVPIFIVLTLRSDYFGHCSAFRDLPEAINNGQYLIPRMTRDQLRAAIEGPVRVEKGQINESLVQRILNDAGDDPDQLPIMQHALMRTWDCWKEAGGGRPIELQDYENAAVGGMAKALSQHADEIYEKLSPEQQKLAKKTFKALTLLGPDRRRVRRPTRLIDLCGIVASDEASLQSMLAPFRNQRCAFVTPPETEELDGQTVLDISHESLMRKWRHLDGWADEAGRHEGWIEEEAVSVQTYRRLVESALLWRKDRAQNAGLLYTGSQLQLALDWRLKTEPNADWARQYHTEFDAVKRNLEPSAYDEAFVAALEFLEESRAEEMRKRERARRERVRQMVLACTVTSMFIVLASLAFLFSSKAKTRLEQLAVSSLQKGWSDMENSRLVDALVWYSDAATILSSASGSEQSHRLRLGLLLRQFPTLSNVFTHNHGLSKVQFSPDNNRILAVSGTNVIVWTRNPGSGIWETNRIFSGPGRILSARFHPTGRYMAATGVKGFAVVWEIDGSIRRELPHSTNHVVNYAEFSKDGASIITACEDGFVRKWNWLAPPADPTRGKLLELAHGGPVSHVSFGANDRYLVAAGGGTNPAVQVWNSTGQPYLVITSTNTFLSAFLSPDATKLFAASADGRARIWGIASSKQPGGGAVPVLVTDLAHHDPHAKVYLRSGPITNRIVTASDNGYAVLWDEGSRVKRELEHPPSVNWSCLSPDAKWAVTAGNDGTAVLWDFETGILLRLMPHGSKVTSASFSSDGEQVATASEDGTIKVWGLRPSRIFPHPRRVRSGDVDKAERLVVTASDDDLAHIWNIEEGRVIYRSDPVPEINRVLFAVTPGRVVITHNETGLEEAKAWDYLPKDLQLVKLSNSELADERGPLPIKPPAQDPPRRVLQAIDPVDTVEQVSTPDGRRSLLRLRSGVTGQWRNAAWLWDTDAQEPLTPLPHSDGINSITFSPSGRFALTCSDDGTARLWDLEPPDAPLWKVQALVRAVTGRKVAENGSVVALRPDEVKAAWLESQQ